MFNSSFVKQVVLSAGMLLGSLGLGTSQVAAQAQTFAGSTGLISYTETTYTFTSSGRVDKTYRRMSDATSRAITTLGSAVSGEQSWIDGTFSPDGLRFVFYSLSDFRVHIANPDGS